MARSYTGAFELRRLLVKFARTPSGGLIEGQAMFSIHLLKLTATLPDANWLTADYTACEGALDTWWTAQKVDHGVTTALTEYRWYKSGPVFEPDDLAPGPSNASIRTTARAVPGTAVSTQMPPQVALTITEIVEVRKRWGRMYLPAITGGQVNSDGRYSNPATAVGRMVTAFNTMRAAGILPVVFTRGRTPYTTVHGTEIADHPATAYEVTDLQVDNLLDIQRSRRWSGPTVRSRTALT